MHSISWEIAFALFVIAIILYKIGQEKAAKIVTMMLRLAYLFVLGTGIYLLMKIGFAGLYYLKMILGILTIGLMEMIIGGLSKGKKLTWQWLVFLVVFAGTIYLGIRLPL